MLGIITAVYKFYFRKSSDLTDTVTSQTSVGKASGKPQLSPVLPAPDKDPYLDIKTPSLLRALLRTFGGYYATAGLLLFCYNLIAFVNPQLLQ